MILEEPGVLETPGVHRVVTGVAGFIGSSLLEDLLSLGQTVVGLDNFSTGHRANLSEVLRGPIEMCARFHMVEGDIRDEALVEKVFTTYPISVVVHLAARAGVRPSIQQPVLYCDVNVRGTTNLLEACRRHGIAKFIFGSSSSVYGNNTKLPFSEKDDVDRPISPYAATKRSGELLCATYHELYRLNVFALRFFTVYGPRQRPEMAIHKFTRLVDQGRPVPRFGSLRGPGKRVTYSELAWTRWSMADMSEVCQMASSDRTQTSGSSWSCRRPCSAGLELSVRGRGPA